jgi:hypothetical protein
VASIATVSPDAWYLAGTAVALAGVIVVADVVALELPQPAASSSDETVSTPTNRAGRPP